MSLLRIRLFGDPVLRQEAREVDTFDDRLRRLADDMLDTMRDAPGVGLAAPQVGVLKRLFTFEFPGVEDAETGEELRPGEDGAVANPVLVDASDDAEEDDEGCLSFPGLFYPVERPLHVEIQWQDLDGDQHTRQLSSFEARVWLHEMDHLDGILFIDHLARHDRKEAMRRIRRGELEHPPAQTSAAEL